MELGIKVSVNFGVKFGVKRCVKLGVKLIVKLGVPLPNQSGPSYNDYSGKYRETGDVHLHSCAPLCGRAEVEIEKWAQLAFNGQQKAKKDFKLLYAALRWYRLSSQLVVSQTWLPLFEKAHQRVCFVTQPHQLNATLP
jgi:hypothetical protein